MLSNEILGKIWRRAYEKDLDGSEIKMLMSVTLNINEKGFCSVSNEKFAIRLNASPRSVTGWLQTLKENRLINIIQNNHRHERWIYITGLKFENYATPTLEDMSPEQKMFNEAFPARTIDCEVPDEVDMKQLIYNIQRSKFLRNAHNMSLKSCCMKFYKQIMAGWQDAENLPPKSNFSTGRNYTKEEMNGLLQKADEIEI